MIGKVLRWGVTLAILALLVLFARTVDWTAAWIAMRGASIPLLLLAFAANTVSVLLRIVRWWLFLRPAGAPSLGMAMKAGIAGVGLNNVLLANGGEAARVVFVSSASGVPSATVLATIALERMFDIVGFIVMVVAGTLIFPLPPEMEGYRVPAMIVLVLVLGGLGLLVYSTRKMTPATLAHRPVEITPPVGIIAKVGSFFKWFAASMGALANGPRFAGALTLSLLAWVFQIVTFALCAKAAGVEVP
ncbi:MAG: lysylphosphatidylglycerol synthase transmembrane domain-containing protein, partial [Gemmatimonadaceae bacterium]